MDLRHRSPSVFAEQRGWTKIRGLIDHCSMVYHLVHTLRPRHHHVTRFLPEFDIVNVIGIQRFVTQKNLPMAALRNTVLKLLSFRQVTPLLVDDLFQTGMSQGIAAKLRFCVRVGGIFSNKERPLLISFWIWSIPAASRAKVHRIQIPRFLMQWGDGVVRGEVAENVS